MPDLPIPGDFLFGTSTAAYQIEGAARADGRGESIWDTFSHTPGKVRNGDTGDVACDHYRRLDSDLDLLAELGVGAYRFSVSWSRIQPDGKGPADQAGLDFYRRLVDGLRQRGIEPALTLYHFDLPQPLQDAGGWPARDTASRFAEYAEIVASALGDSVGKWITLNEPWCTAWLGYGIGIHAPGVLDLGQALAATHHLLLGHGEGVQAIRAARPGAEVGISLNPAVIRPASQHPDDLAAARLVQGNQNRLFFDPILLGTYPTEIWEHFERHLPASSVIEDGDIDVISQPLDFLGVNYYFPNTIAALSRKAEARTAGYYVSAQEPDLLSADLGSMAVGRPGYERTQMDWEIEAGSLNELLVNLNREYQLPPVYITESGAACADYVDPDGAVHDPVRINYLRDHLRAVLTAREAGVDVRGYFVWSLLDNFEWAEGFSKRFGLTWVDYPTGTRIPKDSFRWYQNTIRTRTLTP
ncbi:MAG TPA: GH1 family beta-glucosidase [Streptosporangiaceae bacterium]|nr:GH1 family beta-glucosidase [Streptosporangiaceae bacterium]